MARSERDVRMEVFNSFKDHYASAPIRLMSRTVNAMRSLGYSDLASAIGDLDRRTVPPDDLEDPCLRQDWYDELLSAFEYIGGWVRQLSAHPMGYNVDSIGFPRITSSWGALWSRQLGIDFKNEAHSPPQIMAFHGGNQALQAALQGVAEARRSRVGTGSPATVLVPIPTFTCPMDQMALLGMRAAFLPPGRADMDPSPEDLDQLPDNVDIDGVYLMPINNPTGRTLPPEQMRAFIDAVLDRWPRATVILDSVYVRLHPQYRHLLTWYEEDPRYAEAVLFIDSMQAATASLLAAFLSGDEELVEHRIRLQMRIGRHLQRRRSLLLNEAFVRYRELLDSEQPLLPDPEGFDWEGSMYAVPRLSERCRELGAESGVSPTVAFYLETGIGGVPLDGFCRNPNLERHGLVVNGDSPRLKDFLEEARNFVRLSFGMTPPPS
jgi:aspartate/methionine/tyrosine aminotransferase